LLDDVLPRGPYEESLFTDEKGHQGKIIVETGSLMWLSGLYGVALSSNDFDTGFDSDLQSVAAEIMQEHDPNYSR
jgi:phosphoribosylformylglycinamidine (FGAM) synthase-like enzyme